MLSRFRLDLRRLLRRCLGGRRSSDRAESELLGQGMEEEAQEAEPQDGAKHPLQHRWPEKLRSSELEYLSGASGCTSVLELRRKRFQSFSLPYSFDSAQDKAWQETQREVHSFETAEE